MTTPSAAAHPAALAIDHPVNVAVTPQLTGRNRLTCAFRPILAIPHILMIGSPAAIIFTLGWHSHGEPHPDWGAGPGALGAVAFVAAMIAWFAIVFTGRAPRGLMDLGAFFLRWRVRAIAYMALLRDEYPPFDDGAYPATVMLPTPPPAVRNRLTVAFRLILAIPHLIAVAFIGLGWFITTLIAWLTILVTGTYPLSLYHFAEGALRWTTRVEAYLLLLHDEYPPFAFE